jgi:hypothetical protein
MNSKTFTLLVTLVGVICGLYIINSFVLGHFFTNPRTVRTDVQQGILIGYGLALVTIYIYARTNGMLLRAAHALIFPGPVNVPKEAMYWTTSIDGAGHTLNGRKNYIIHFPPGGLPPNNAFWSLTMGDAQNRFVPNPINRYSVSDRSGLPQNADGSVDIYIQNAAPAGHESNWLPAPSGNFILWLRAYMPDAAILNGEYEVPPLVETK